MSSRIRAFITKDTSRHRSQDSMVRSRGNIRWRERPGLFQGSLESIGPIVLRCQQINPIKVTLARGKQSFKIILDAIDPSLSTSLIVRPAFDADGANSHTMTNDGHPTR